MDNFWGVEEEQNNFRKANVLEDMKSYEDYKFNMIYSDPPYNLGSTWYIDPVDGKYKIKKKADFMNKWDGLDEDDIDTFFKEGYRVLKHGGWLIMYSMDRQIGPMLYYAQKNGFVQHQSLYWYFISSFPKATDASKMVDKRLGKMGDIDITKSKSKEGKLLEGYKYSIAPLKQVVETILVFKKPHKNKSCLDDMIEYLKNPDLATYQPKVAKKERNAGLELEPDKIIKSNQLNSKACINDTRNTTNSKEFVAKNSHPTLKPIELNNKITSLFKLPKELNQYVYVPFSGVMSEYIGLLKAGYNPDNIWTCEINDEYYETGLKRVDYWKGKYGH